MRYLSVCSGIEAATVAWHKLGWSPVAFSEIEAFPSSVLEHRFPSVPNLGDMTKYKEWNLGKESVDLLVGGTPCQSFSVAGLRGGIADPRGNLMLIYGAIADHFKPRWIVWENVPGVLSSGGGRDFGSFLGMLAEIGYGFAYRVLDAQYFGVAQRRRRVFVVGYLGDWRRAAAVLFESESLCGHPAPSREAGKGFASVAGTLAANGGGTNRPAGNCNELDFCIPVSIQDIRGMDKAQNGKGWNDNGTSYTVDAMATQGVSYATNIRLRGRGFDASEDGTGRGTPLVPVTFEPGIMSREGGHVYEGLSGTLRKDPGDNQMSVMYNSAVRRLTPRECERLQGFPDDWTLIPWKGRPSGDCPDGPRYKACGNSMAVPVMAWIGKRIDNTENGGRDV